MKTRSILASFGLWLTLAAQAFADETLYMHLSGGAAWSSHVGTIHPQAHLDLGVPLLKLLRVGISGSLGPQTTTKWLSGSTLYSLGIQTSVWIPLTGLYAGLRFGGSVLTDPVVGSIRLLDSTTTFLMLNPFLGWEVSWIPFLKPGIQLGYYLPIQRSEFNALSSLHLMLALRLSI